MRLLLDTHVVLWAFSGDARLPTPMRETISAASERLVSAVTAYELGLKTAIGKLVTPADLDERLDDFGVTRLAITWAHTHAASRLPLHHRDPWDRILIAQARLEGLTLVSADEAMTRYDVALVRAVASVERGDLAP